MARVPALFVLACAVAFAGCGGGSGSDDGSESPPVQSTTSHLPEQGNDLFVLRGPATVSGQRIEIDTETVEWFTDRPKRRAGVADAKELVENWEDYGFAADPPNAALAGSETDAEVELSDVEATDDGLSFAYEPVRGEVAPEEESLSVFIDSAADSIPTLKPSSLDFGTVTMGDTSTPQTLTGSDLPVDDVASVNDNKYQVAEPTITGSNNFSVNGEPSCDLKKAVSAAYGVVYTTCTVNVEFGPTATAEANATLTWSGATASLQGAGKPRSGMFDTPPETQD